MIKAFTTHYNDQTHGIQINIIKQDIISETNAEFNVCESQIVVLQMLFVKYSSKREYIRFVKRGIHVFVSYQIIW